jgi:hypothetical protein
MTSLEDLSSQGLWMVWDGKDLSLPYPGSLPVGSKEAADHVVNANTHNGYQAVQMTVDFAEEGHQCEWEHTHSEPNHGAHYECRICGARTP